MANRKILYGYQIIHGDLVIQEEERLTVQNIFTTYLAGLSYQALADRKDKWEVSTPDGIGWLMAKAAKRMLSDSPAPNRRANRAYRKRPSEMFCLQKRICCREGGTACADGTAACGT